MHLLKRRCFDTTAIKHSLKILTIKMLNKALLSLEENLISCRADKDSYPHDGRADKGRYRHDSRADKNPYPISARPSCG